MLGIFASYEDHEHLRGSFSPTVKGKVVPKRPKEGMMKNDVVTFLLKKLFGTFHQQIFISLVLACLVVSLLFHLLLLKAKFWTCDLVGAGPIESLQ